MTSASSGLRPTKGVVGTGRFEGDTVLSGGNGRIAELVQPLRYRKILQMVFAEVDERPIADRRGGRRRHQHLPSVTYGGDACRPMDVDADVALVRRERVPRVDADPHANRPGLERLTGGTGRVDRAGGRGERDEERVPLRVDLNPAVASEGVAEETAMLREDLRVRCIPQFVDEPRGAFDVREEERDGSGGQVRSCHDAREHTLVEPPGRPADPARGTMSARR